MAVTAFQDLPLADRDREWDGDAADKRVRTWAGAEDEPNEKYRDAHVWYDADNKDNFTAYKLLIADVVDGQAQGRPARGDGGRRRHAGRPRWRRPSRQATSTGSRATWRSTTPRWTTTAPWEE